MAFKWILFLSVPVILAVLVSSDKKACIKGKYEQSLGKPFNDCFQRKRSTEIKRIKDCYQDIMKEKGVVETKNRQMTVNSKEFAEYSSQNKNNAIGKAMKTCYDNPPAGDDMFKEAARASECVFDKVKATC